MQSNAPKVAAAPKKREQRVRLAPLTQLRRYRLERAVSLADAASTSGISTARVSVVERDPALARPGEIDRLLRAVDIIAKARKVTT